MNLANGHPAMPPASPMPPPAGPVSFAPAAAFAPPTAFAPATFEPAAPASGSFSLSPGRDDTALFRDERAAFSHLLPGRPTLELPDPSDPFPADAVLTLRDAPVSVRYRLAPPAVAVPTASDLARATAAGHARARAHAEVPVDGANPSWLSAWGVEAAAIASYEVPLGSGASIREDLFVLVRGGMVLTVTWRCPRAFVDEPEYAAFASVAEATMVWDPARWRQHGRVWPESAFVRAGLRGAARPGYDDGAKRLARAPMPPRDRARLVAVLAGLVSGAGAPWVRLTPEIKEASRRAIVEATGSASVRAFVDAAFAEIATAHDLRAFATILGRPFA